MFLLQKRFIKLTLILLCAVFVYQFSSTTALAATVTWDGGGTDGTCGGNAGDGNKWSCAANWSSDAVPTSSDDVVFDGTSTKDANIDQSIDINSISINTGYSGTVTQDTDDTIYIDNYINDSFSQSDGTFVGSNADITLYRGGFYQNGGNFTSTSGNLTVENNLNLAGGTFSDNGGSITLSGSSNIAISCNSNSLNQLIIDKTYSTNQLTFGNTCSISIVGSNPTSTGTITNNGTINVTGNWSINGGYISNSGATLNMTGNTMSMSGNYGYLVLNGGNFPAGVNNISVSSHLNNSANILQDGVDLTINGSVQSDLTCGNANFNSVTFDKSFPSVNIVIDSSCDIDLPGTNPSDSGYIINNGTINVTGNWSINGGYTSNSSATLNMTGDTLTLTGNSGDLILNGGNFPAGITNIYISDDLDNSGNILQDGVDLTVDGGNESVLSCGNTSFNDVTISKAGPNYSVEIGSDCNIPIIGNNPNNQGYITNNGAISVTGNWTHAGGYVSNPGSSLTITGDTLAFTSSFGDLNWQGATFPNNVTSVFIGDDLDNSANLIPDGVNLTFNSSGDSNVTCGSTVFGDVEVDKLASYNDFTPLDDCRMSGFSYVGGDFINPTSYVNYIVTGDLSLQNEYNSTIGGNNFSIILSGNNNQYITNNIYYEGDLTVNKTSGQAQLQTNFYSTTANCVVENGTLFLNGFNMNCDGGNQLNGGTLLKMIGGELFGSNPILASNSTVEIVGNGDSNQNIFNLSNWDYKNLIINLTDAADIVNENSLTLNLVGYWKMEEGSGSSVEDSSTNSNDAQIAANAFFSSETPTLQETNNYSIDITHQNTSYLNPGSNLDIAQNKSQVSVAAWIKADALPSYTTQDIFGLSSGTSTSLSRVNMQTYGDEVQCGGRSNDNDSFVYAVTSSVNLTTGAWHHLACVFDYENNAISVYVDGQKISATKNGNFGSSSTSDTASVNSAIGIDEDKNGSNFDGRIDEVRVYDRALLNNEINLLANGYATSYLDTLAIDENFTISNGTLISPSSLTVSGNWINNGTFTANGGTVILDGVGQLLTGSTTFYNLTKNNTGSADTLTFTAGDTQTITNDLTLTGESGAVLSLRSSSQDIQWSIDPQGGRTISYLDVQDSNNTNATAISTAGLNITNSGNNTNWDFDSSPPSLSLTPISPDPGLDTTPDLTGTATEAVGTVSSVEYQMDGTAGSWSNCTADDGGFDEASEAFTCTISPALSDGTHTIYVRATDSNANTTTDGAAATDGFTVDTTAPSVPGTPTAITASDDTTPTWNFAESTDATTSLATTDAYTLQWSTDSNFASGVSSTTLQTTDCSADTCSFTHSSSLTDNTWYFRAKAKDVLDNESAYSAAGSITISTDSNPPTGSITINIGDSTNPAFTRSTDATLAITATDDVTATANIQMMVANSSDFSGASWESFTTTKSWTLTDEDGEKTVYVKFKDELGNTSEAYSDSIKLDTTKPTNASLVSPANETATNNPTPSFTFKKVTDELGDITKYKLIIDDKSFIDNIDHNDPGGNHVRENDDRFIYYQGDEIKVYGKKELSEATHRWRVDAYDSVGNISQSDTRTLTIDRSLPSISLATIAGISVNISSTSEEYLPAVVATTQPKFIGGSEANATITIKDSKSSEILCETTSDENGSWSCHPDLAISFGLHKIIVQATDAAGNSSQLPTIALTVGSGQLQLTVEKQKVTATPKPSPTPSLKRANDEQDQEKQKQVPANKTYQVSILITDKDGNPLPFVTVHLFSEPKTTVTDENGYANFVDVPKGDHTLVVESEDYVGKQQITLDGDVTKHEIAVSIEKKMSLREILLIILSSALVISTLTFISLYVREIKRNRSSLT